MFGLGFARGRGGLAAIDDHAGRALVVGCFVLTVGLEPSVVHAGEVVLDREGVALLGAQAAADTADLAEGPRVLAVLLAAASDGHHVLVGERDHLDQVAGAGLRAGAAAGAFGVVYGGQTVDNVQGVELADAGTVAQAQAPELAGLHVRQGVGRGAAWDALIAAVEGLV